MGKDDGQLIIEGLLNAIYNILSSLFSGLDIPGLPDETSQAILEFYNYLEFADGLINLVFPIDLGIYFTIFFALFGFEHLYPVIMWILRKIPMLGIE